MTDEMMQPAAPVIKLLNPEEETTARGAPLPTQQQPQQPQQILNVLPEVMELLRLREEVVVESRRMLDRRRELLAGINSGTIELKAAVIEILDDAGMTLLPMIRQLVEGTTRAFDATNQYTDIMVQSLASQDGESGDDDDEEMSVLLDEHAQQLTDVLLKCLTLVNERMKSDPASDRLKLMDREIHDALHLVEECNSEETEES